MLKVSKLRKKVDDMMCAFKPKNREKNDNSVLSSLVASGEASNSIEGSHKPSTSNSDQWPGLSVMIPEINMDLFGFESYTLLIRRGRQGFGFTVLGSCPVQVGRIDKDSPADVAGLLVEDCIVRINGQNVSRSAADSVARIVRDSEKYVIMEIYRLPVSSIDSPALQMTSTPWLPHSGFLPPSNSSLQSNSNPSASVLRSKSQRSRPPFNAITNTNPSRDSRSIKSDIRGHCDIIVSKRDATPSRNSVNHSSVTSYRINGNGSSVSAGQGEGPRINKQSASSVIKNSGGSDGVSMGSGSSRSGSTSTISGGTGEKIGKTKARIDIDDTMSISSSQLSPEENQACNENLRNECVEALVTCEEEFLLDIQLGVKRYLRPLKNYGLISHNEHAAVFQNIETIAALAEYHVRQLQSRRVWRRSAERELINENRKNSNETETTQKTAPESPVKRSIANSEENTLRSSSLTVDALADVYITKAEEFCDAYETYCGGVKEAFRMLIALKRQPEVEEFLRAASMDCGPHTLSNLLQSPLQHIRDIVLTMQRLLQHTPSGSQDYRKLKSVIQGIRACCHRINESNTQRYGSSLTLASTANSSLVKRHPSSISSSSSSSSVSSESMTSSTFAASVVSSIDTELLDIQGRLVFPPDIPSFQLATAAHHLIYSGQLHLIDREPEDEATPSGSAAVQLFVLLLSDLILLTRPDPDSELLHVIEEPIILRDIVGSNFNCPNACEFLLCVETPMTGLHETWEPYPVLLRAPSVELKCTWKNILEQRIFSCKSMREQTIANKALTNIV